jgi:prevent-host-death family protein
MSITVRVVGTFRDHPGWTGGDDVREQLPTTQTSKISEVRDRFNDLVDRVYRKDTRVIVEKSGIPVAGIVSADDLRRLDQEQAEHFDVIDEMRAAFRDVPTEEIEREAERTLAEVRAGRRGERQ